MDAIDDDEKETQDQTYLNLEDQGNGKVRVLQDIEEQVDYKPIIDKTSSKNQHQMLGEIVADDGRRVRITTRHIFILEEELGDELKVKMTHVFENRNIARFICADGKWIYVLKRHAISYDNVLQREGGAAQIPGLWVIDFKRLCEGHLEIQ